MSAHRNARSRSKNFRLFKAGLHKPAQEEQKFNFTASFFPEQLDFSAYLANVKEQKDELPSETKDSPVSDVTKLEAQKGPKQENPSQTGFKLPRSLIGAVSSKDNKLLEEILQESDSSDCSPSQLNHALMFSITMREAAITERLLKAGADMHAFDSWYPVLLTAIDIKATNIFEILIRHCKDVNVSSNYGNLLHSAVRTGDIDFVKRVFDLGIDVNLQCKANLCTPLHEAVKCVKFNGKGILELGSNFTLNPKKRNANHLEAIDASASPEVSEDHFEVSDASEISKGAKVSGEESVKEETVKDKSMKEQSNYDMEIITFLISKNCDIDAKDIKGKTALHHACILSNHEVVDFLLKSGANPHIMDESSNIPVMYALNQNNNKIVKMLIKEDEVNKPVTKTQYYVHMTSKCGSIKCLQHLIKMGADLTVRDTSDHGNTPLMVAVSSNASLEYLNCILSHESAINKVNSDGDTALDLILTKWNELRNPDDYLNLMVQAGADIDQVHPNTGLTQLTTYGHHPSITESLLKQGADINIVGKTGNNVLLQACQSSCENTVNTLMNYGMDIRLMELVNTEGSEANLTPLQICIRNSMVDLAETLLCAGASLRNMHQWIKQSEHCTELRRDNAKFDAICQHIERTTRGPPGLAEMCRMSVLKAVGPSPTEVTFSQLCLPVSVKQELPWEAYLNTRKDEFRTMYNIED